MQPCGGAEQAGKAAAGTQESENRLRVTQKNAGVQIALV
jgi:hypothetical protein